MSTQEYLILLEDCEDRESKLSDWERGFIDSLRQQVDAGRRPSDKQMAVLERIWQNVT